MVDDTQFAAHTNIRWNGNVGITEYGNGDRGMVVMFFNKAVHNPAKSAQSGRPVYEDVTYVRIHPPGERLNIIERVADESHKRRWPMHWQAFMQKKEQFQEGTPIDLLYPEHPSIGAMLRSNGVHTVEQCAELSGNAIDSVGMGAQSYVNMAQKYLKAANKGATSTEMRRELDIRDQKIKTLERQLSDQKEKIEQLLSNRSNAQISAEQVQAAIAQVMSRPVHMPTVPFDPATAQINAVHPSNTVKRQRSRSRLG